MGYDYVKVVLSPDLIKQSIVETSAAIQRVFQALEAEGVKADNVFSNKNKSELISTILETKLAEILDANLPDDTVVNAQCDADPDIRLVEKDIPIEIKVTSTADAWTGGSYSNRPANYLLVSWGGNYDEFYVGLAYIDKEDWKSGGANYYGTSYSKKDLSKNPTHLDLFGALEVTETAVNRRVKMKRAKLSDPSK